MLSHNNARGIRQTQNHFSNANLALSRVLWYWITYPFIIFDVDIITYLKKVSQNFFTATSFSCHMKGSYLIEKDKYNWLTFQQLVYRLISLMASIKMLWDFYSWWWDVVAFNMTGLSCNWIDCMCTTRSCGACRQAIPKTAEIGWLQVDLCNWGNFDSW